VIAPWRKLECRRDGAGRECGRDYITTS